MVWSKEDGRLRVARPADYDRIAAVIDDWWGRPVRASLPRLFLDHFWTTSRVAEDDFGLAGFLVAFVSPSEPEIAYLHVVGVRPDRRRSGLAESFYGAFLVYATSVGCGEARAVTAPGNEGSIRFHRRLGFDVSAPVPNYNGAGRPMVIFTRALGHEQDRTSWPMRT
ncbi:MAG: GNAT family N-acetyltransferase [Actinomycetota bacterium]|nr:GNAT family N-acetyltransferase [Actinomycetota bacterium]